MKKLSKSALKTQISKLQVTSAVLYVALAVAAAVLIVNNSISFSLGFLSKDEILSQTDIVLSPASHNLMTVQLGQLLAAFLGISALGLALIATKFKKAYEKSVKAEISGYRWVYMGFSNAMIISFLAVLMGVYDIATLKMSAILIVLAAVFAWIAERDNKGAKKPRWLAYLGAVVAGLFALYPIIGSFVGTALYASNTELTWYICAAAGLSVLGLIGFATNQCRSIRRKGNFAEYLFVERNYFAIDLGIKLSVALTVLIALHK